MLAEFELEEGQEYEAGQSLTVDLFEVGQRVKITGVTKGRGFQGTVKRHNFAGSRASARRQFRPAEAWLDRSGYGSV